MAGTATPLTATASERRTKRAGPQCRDRARPPRFQARMDPLIAGPYFTPTGWL